MLAIKRLGKLIGFTRSATIIVNILIAPSAWVPYIPKDSAFATVTPTDRSDYVFGHPTMHASP
jgi:hypothetical protein